MCRGGYWLDKAPRPTAHGASSRPVTPDRMKACLDVSSVDRVTLSDRECRGASRDADLADRDSAEDLAGELDDDHVLARLASAAWPGRAARHAEHRYPPRAGGARTRQLRLQARRSRRTGRSPACPRLCSPFCSPGGPFRCYSPAAGTRSTGLSCGNSRAGSQHPGVYLPALQEVRGHFSRSQYAIDLRKCGA